MQICSLMYYSKDCSTFEFYTSGIGAYSTIFANYAQVIIAAILLFSTWLRIKLYAVGVANGEYVNGILLYGIN